MKRRQLIRASAAMALAAGLSAPALAAYPDRPITLIVPWGAGGGTDAVGRYIGTELEKELKRPVNVVNRTGGSGVVGHTAISSAPPDGYTIGIITVEITMMKHVGLTQLDLQHIPSLPRAHTVARKEILRLHGELQLDAPGQVRVRKAGLVPA